MPGNLSGRKDGQTDGRTDGRTCRKTVTVGRVDQRTHVQVKKGYFRLRTDGRTDGQPENIMPPAPKGGGIMKINLYVSQNSLSITRVNSLLTFSLASSAACSTPTNQRSSWAGSVELMSTHLQQWHYLINIP